MATTYERQSTGLVRGISAWRAFVLNLMFTSPAFMLIFLVIGQGLFPRANLPISSFLALGPALLIGFIYTQFSAALPRSGGDYIFVGRVLHPSLGFMVNFVLTVINISVIGVEAVWITTFALGPMLNVLTVLTGNTVYSTWATTLTMPLNSFIIGALVATLVPLLMYFGTNVSFRIQTALFVLTTASVLVFVVALAGISQSTFASNFNSISGSNVTAVVSAAKNGGANLSFDTNGTLLGIVYTYLAVSGFWGSAYVAGEVKRPEKSQLSGMLFAPVFYVVLMALVALVAYSSIGHDFLASISFLALNYGSNPSPAYTIPANPPILQVLAAYATRNVPIVVFLFIGLLSTLLAYMIAATFTSVRCLFAWSFDSIIPRKFSDVHPKYRIPHFALFAVIVVNLIFVYLTVYTTITAFFTYVVTGVFISLVFVGVAAVLFPYRRRDVFNSAPSITTARIGSVPVMTLLGVLLIITSLLIGYASLLPSLVGPLNPAYVAVIPSLFVIGFVLYWISYGIQKGRGVPMDKLLKEIPPE